jgi:hypothetical protein
LDTEVFAFCKVFKTKAINQINNAEENQAINSDDYNQNQSIQIKKEKE